MDENDTEATQTSLTICTESRALVFLYEDGTVELAPELIALAQAAIENIPYTPLGHGKWDDDFTVFTPETLRGFYEGTWQGSHADEIFPAAAEAAAKAVAKSILTAIAKQHSFTMEEF